MPYLICPVGHTCCSFFRILYTGKHVQTRCPFLAMCSCDPLSSGDVSLTWVSSRCRSLDML